MTRTRKRLLVGVILTRLATATAATAFGLQMMRERDAVDQMFCHCGDVLG